MRIVVCIKQILDPELPPKEFQVDPTTRQAVRGRASLVINPFDQNALEVALQLKERDASGSVVALSLGAAEAKEALRKALAMGCDEAVLVDGQAVAPLDAAMTAAILAEAVRAVGFDLVLCGRQAGDWDQGQTGPLLAEALGVPCVPAVFRTGPPAQPLEFHCEAGGGWQRVAARLPAVATVTNAQSNQPRLPKVRDIMQANRKQVRELSLAALGVDPSGAHAWRRTEVLDLQVPTAARQCELIDGETGAEKGAKLAERLRARKVI